MPPETIVIHKGHGLPTRRADGTVAVGERAQPERSFELAREIERRLLLRGDREIDVDGLGLCLEVLRAGRRARCAAISAGAASTGSTARWWC